jgi:hypothetical protein
MAYKNPVLSDYTFSYWVHDRDGQGDLELRPNPDSGNLIIYQSRLNFVNVVYKLSITGNITSCDKYYTIAMFIGWNLHTVRVYLDSTNTL